MGKVPKIRFRGFDGEWEEKKLSDITTPTGVRNKNNLPLEAFAITSEGGFVPQSIAHDDFGYMKDTDHKAYIIVRPHSFGYNPARINIGSLGYYEGTEDVIVSSLYEVFQTSDDIDDHFLNCWFSSKAFSKWIQKLQEGSVRLYFYYDKLCECKTLLPSLAEQKSIAELLHTVDANISDHQRKLAETQTLKQYLLRNMFPAPGEAVPAIRFEGFEGEWEEKKFGELTELKSASRVHKEEWKVNGIPFYRSSDVMAALNGTENEKAYISEELYEKLSAVSGKLEKGDVLVTGGGSVGKPYIVPNDDPLYTKDADLLWIKRSEQLDPYFIYTFFLSPGFADYLSSVSHVGTIAHYTITQLSETPISLPVVEEQKKIGVFFAEFDESINHTKQKIAALNTLKQYLLQNMFPTKG